MVLLFLKWLLLIPCYYAITLASWLVAPIAPLFRQEDYYLPPWLKWANTFTDTLLGDKNHQRRCKEAGMSEYAQMVTWILRNPGRVGQSKWIGFMMKEQDTEETFGNPDAGDNHGISGTMFVKVYREGRVVCFQHYAVLQYPFRPDKCWRSIIGWKLWEHPTVSDQPKQFSFIIQPWKTFQIK